MLSTQVIATQQNTRIQSLQALFIRRKGLSLFLIIGIMATFLTMITHFSAASYSMSLTLPEAQSTQILPAQAINAAMPATKATHTASTNRNASHDLVRISQLDPTQYNSQQDYNTWAYSACSTAAMTTVINAYGHHYRIADILKVEAGLHEITPDQGLLEPSGIDQTVAQFGFQTNWLDNPSLDTVITTANQGHPVIVGFPPNLWAGGHLLVVRGGNSQSVLLADSSRLNMQVMARSTFLTHWVGFAAVVTPKTATTTTTTTSTTDYSIVGKPSISAAFINQVLAANNSPAAGKGQALYNLGSKYGIDPAFALAFFLHESAFGTQGEATKTLSLGNSRCIANAACVDEDRGGYAAFPTWEAGFQAWYQMMQAGYVQGGINTTIGRDACPCTTVQQIIPVYAPTADHNDESAYIASLIHAITIWHSGQVLV